MVIEQCGFGMRVNIFSLLRVCQVPSPTEDSLVRVSGGLAVKLKGSMQLNPSHIPTGVTPNKGLS